MRFGLGATRDPAECEIKVEGEAISDLYPFLISVTVECSRGKDTAEATLVFEGRRDEKGRWQVLDDRKLVPWAAVQINALFGSSREEILRGYVHHVSPQFPAEAAAARVVVTVQDELYALDRSHVRKRWGDDESPVTDRDILEEIAGNHGLEVDEDSSDGQSGLSLNQDSTDATFLRKRARLNGYELVVSRGTIYFGPPRLNAEPQPSLLAYAGPDTNLRNLDVTVDGHKPDRIAFHLAPEQGTEIREVTVEPDLDLLGPEAPDSGGGLDDFVWRLSRQGSVSEEQLTALAQQRVNEAALHVIAQGEVDGTLYGHVLQVALPVKVDGIGEWLSGTYYVDRVSHRFDAGGYAQGITLRRNAYGDDSAGGAPDPLAAVR